MASSILDSIKETILGVKSSNIDKLIDTSLDNIGMYSSNSDTNKYLDAMKDLIKTVSSNNKTVDSVIGQLQKGMPQVQNYDQSGRVTRYAEYEAICNKIAYVEKAIDVLTDHIIAPDDILKYSIQFISKRSDIKDPNVSIAITRLKQIEEHFKFEEKVKKLVKDTLKFGDNFIELVPTPKGKNALVVVNESFDFNALNGTKVLLDKHQCVLETVTKKFDYEKWQETESEPVKKPFTITIDESTLDYNNDNKPHVLNEDYSYMIGGLGGIIIGPNSPNMMNNITAYNINDPRSKDTHQVAHVGDDKFQSKFVDPDKVKLQKDEDGQTRLELSDINLVIHEPKYVIRLETERFKVCLGYLVFPKVDPATMLNTGVTTNIDAICANLLKTVQQKLSNRSSIIKNDKIKVSDDIRKVLLAHLQKIDNNDDLQIRYVAPEFMQHFRINVSRYSPYGQSVIDSSMYDAKLLMALKTASTIKKINAASDKRFVSVEVGLPRDAKNVVEKMQENLNKKRISVGSLGAIDTIPSQISTFETIYIPMKDGKKFVEIDHQNWGGDTSNDVDNQKQMRDSIVANFGVPSAYLNIEENSSNRSILTVESINFCRTIISYQKEFSPQLHEFFSKVYILIYGKNDCDILKNIRMTFNQPKGLPNSAQAEILESTQRLIDTLSNLGLSKKMLVKKYLPDIDWEEAEKANASEKLDMETNEAMNGGGDMMGGMGGFGGMTGGMGGGLGM